MTPSILAHRGNVNGPTPREENRMPTIQRALRRGWSLEIDIRRAGDGRFYLSHDALSSADEGAPTDVWAATLRRYPEATVALNIKELGYEAELLHLLRAAGVIDQVVLFDMELIEAVPGDTARRFRSLDPDVRIAARVSDRGESIERALAIAAAQVVWLDEFDGPWSTSRDIRALRGAGKSIYVVSPDLHGASLAEARNRWLDFCHWGVDGICTDYPMELERMLPVLNRGVAI
jgi:glycerophosphoryl diester phosphodiesterase